MNDEFREFQVFVKPAGPSCNLSCSYCYYLGKKKLYSKGEIYKMSDSLLEEYIIQHISATTGTVITFSWHGGEPLLAGLDFFKKVIGFQRRHKPAGSTILNGIQTNGTLLDDRWCKFLASEKFIVGISIDGPQNLHDRNRRTKGNKGTFPDVLRGYELLYKNGIIPEILCVVNSENVKEPLVIYNFIKQLYPEYVTFLPLVEPDPQSPSQVSGKSVPSREFGHFLSTIFDEWVVNDIGKIKIQIIEEAARTAFDQEHTLCIFKVECGGVPVVEHNGDFYSCDHYVNEEHLLGNLKDQTLSYYLDCVRQKEFGKAKRVTLPGYCAECEVLAMCNGECPKNRFINTPGGEPGLNYLCAGYKYFFNHCRPFIEAISEAWKNQNE